MKRRLVAWALVNPADEIELLHTEPPNVLDDGDRVVKLVEHDPLTDAVVKAARAAVAGAATGKGWVALCDAVQRHEKGRK